MPTTGPTELRVRSSLRFDVASPSTIRLAIVPPTTPRQHVSDVELRVDPGTVARRERHERRGEPAFEVVVIEAERGALAVDFGASVVLDGVGPTEAGPASEAGGASDVDLLEWLLPSRYCESDRLGNFATKQFGAIGDRIEQVTGICNWIHDHLDYVSGTTGPTTTAVDVLVQCTGVCRDYAHLAIALCRALDIPARYVSGYAADLVPPDFHGFFEAHLDGEWFLFDATRMAPLDGLVRIAAGRDAADAAFSTIWGGAALTELSVVVDRVSGAADWMRTVQRSF